MEIPTAERSLLIAWTWRLLLTAMIFILAYTSIQLLQRRSDAPGVQPAPVESRFGKVNSTDPGASFSSPGFFQHNVYYQVRSDTKLTPEPKNILFHLPDRTVFNIINIISQTISKEYSVSIAQLLSTSYPHGIHDLGNHLTLGSKVIYKMCREVTESEQKHLYTRLCDYLD